MTRCFVLGAAALVAGLLLSNAASAHPRDIRSFPLASDPGWGYRHPNRCLVWDGYRWLNMCYRGRAYFSPAWVRFHR